jgi:histidinol-phosphate aminotransferase
VAHLRPLRAAGDDPGRQARDHALQAGGLALGAARGSREAPGQDSYNVNAITQALGTAALEDRKTHEEAMRGTLDERTRLERELATMGLTWPESRANFLLVEVGDRAEGVYAALKAAGLLVRFFSTPELRTKLRITVGRPDQNNKLIAALRTALV